MTISYENTLLVQEMRRGLEAGSNFTYDMAGPLRNAIAQSNGQINIVATGSSNFSPAGNMARLASLDLQTRHYNIRAMHGTDAVSAADKDAATIYISASGNTDVVKGPARILESRGFTNVCAITTGAKSDLAKICGPEKTIVLPHEEKAIPATETVLLQALLLHAALRPKEQFAPEKMRKVGAHLLHVFNTAVQNERLVERLAYAQSVRLVGSPVMQEISLKFTEACSMNVHAYTGTEPLHGPVQSFHSASGWRRAISRAMPAADDTDVVLLFDPPEHETAFKESLVGRKNLHVWVVGERSKEFEMVRLPSFEDAEFNDYGRLVFAWALLLKVAAARKISPARLDKPEFLTKSVDNGITPRLG